MFYETETLRLAMPASLVAAIQTLRCTGVKPEFPHIDYYLGESNHTSDVKVVVAKVLMEIGFTWMEDCEQCQKDGTLERKLKREKQLAVAEAERILKP